MQKTSLICNTFSGINRSSSMCSASVITASDMQNVELYSTGINSGTGIRTAKGNISVCDDIPDGESVVNIFESVQKNNIYFFVHTENSEQGKLYLFNRDSGSLILKAEGLSVTGKSSGCDVSQGWADLFVFSNGEEILSVELNHYDTQGNLDEVKMMELKDSEGRTVKGLGLVVFSGRLWIFSNQILWYSVQEDIYDFETSDAEITTSSGFIEFVKNITAIYPYLGSLAVFHKDSSCLIAESDSGSNFYRTQQFPGGCANYASISFHGTELYFYDDTKKGIFCFRQVINGDQTLGENIALDIQEELFGIPQSMLQYIKALSVVTSDRNEVWLLVPDNDSQYSIILIYDYIRKTWIKRKSQKIYCFNVIGGILYSAGEKIFEEYSSNTFDGCFIQAFYKAAPLNLGRENTLKVVNYPPRLSVDMYYRNSFYVEYVKNYNAQSSKIKHISSKILSDYLYFDKGYWDSSYFPDKDINSIKKLPMSYFKTLQITFLTKNIGDDFCIRNIEFEKVKIKSV